MMGGFGRPPPAGAGPPGGFGGPMQPPPMGGASPFPGPGGPGGPGMMGGPPPPGGPAGFGAPPPIAGPGAPGAVPAPPSVAPGAAAHGMEQAKKMQDLLANLVANQGLIANLGNATPNPGGPPPPGSSNGGPPPPGAAGYGPPPPQNGASPLPPFAAGGSPARPPMGSPLVHAGGPGAGSPTTATGSSLPPAVSQLLQQAGGASPIAPAYGGGGSPQQPPAQNPAPTAPATGAEAPTPGSSAPAQVQALLAMLVSPSIPARGYCLQALSLTFALGEHSRLNRRASRRNDSILFFSVLASEGSRRRAVMPSLAK